MLLIHKSLLILKVYVLKFNIIILMCCCAAFPHYALQWRVFRETSVPYLWHINLVVCISDRLFVIFLPFLYRLSALYLLNVLCYCCCINTALCAGTNAFSVHLCGFHWFAYVYAWWRRCCGCICSSSELVPSYVQSCFLSLAVDCCSYSDAANNAFALLIVIHFVLLAQWNHRITGSSYCLLSNLETNFRKTRRLNCENYQCRRITFRTEFVRFACTWLRGNPSLDSLWNLTEYVGPMRRGGSLCPGLWGWTPAPLSLITSSL